MNIKPLQRAPTAPVVSASSPTLVHPRPKRQPSLSLDLSGLPPLQPSATPTQPTNTLLFTNLNNADIFHADNLQTIRDLVSHTAPLHAWSPLRSFRRIIASFFSAEDAARVRAAWDGEPILGEPVQVYYGRPTPLDAGRPGQVQHLALPDAGKLFFISPPPSPPHDWEMRLEGAPNKQVHADDLAEALARLHHHNSGPPAVLDDDVPMRAASRHRATGSIGSTGSTGSIPPSPADSVSPVPGITRSTTARSTRSRSSTLVIYQPHLHATTAGNQQDLPAIAVEDTTQVVDDDDDYDVDMTLSSGSPIMAHTARPPVELMHDA